MADVEQSVLRRQWLDRRLAGRVTLIQELG